VALALVAGVVVWAAVSFVRFAATRPEPDRRFRIPPPAARPQRGAAPAAAVPAHPAFATAALHGPR